MKANEFVHESLNVLFSSDTFLFLDLLIVVGCYKVIFLKLAKLATKKNNFKLTNLVRKKYNSCFLCYTYLQRSFTACVLSHRC